MTDELHLPRMHLAAFGGYELFGSIVEKSAKLVESVTTAHAYSDGNKRLAWHLAVMALGENGHRVECDQDAVADSVVCLVSGGWTLRRFALWLTDHTFLQL